MLLIFLGLLAVCGWIYLVFFHSWFWRGEERLEPAPIQVPAWPAVVGVIPARNEAASIGAVIGAHARADYQGPFRLVLVDDGSNDGTADLARVAAGRLELEILSAQPLPEGWTGKLNAMAEGIARSESEEPPKYLLLCDADIALAPTTLRRLVAKAETEDLALVSLMARLDASGAAGALLIPAFVFFFQKLYPFARSNDTSSPVAAAAGGCMLVRHEALKAAGGLEVIRGELIDDCALARLLKRSGGRIWLGLAGEEAVSLRDNRKFSSIRAMVARTAFTQLRRSWTLLGGAILGMALLYLAPPAIALSFPWHRNDLAAGLALSAWFMMSLAYFPTVRRYGQPSSAALTLPLAAVLYMAMTIESALCHLTGTGGAWKGRTYPR